jgi:hypothetical protein
MRQYQGEVGYENLHKASSASNHDVLDVWTGLKLGGADEDWGTFPDAIL